MGRQQLGIQTDLISAINVASPTPRASVERAQGLDLYCCAGGAGQGYIKAGADMTGVDTGSLGRYYPGRFIQADAITYLSDHGHEYDCTYVTVAGHGGDNPQGSSGIKRWQEAMGINWTNDRHLLAEALPPAYCEYIGTHVLAWL